MDGVDAADQARQVKRPEEVQRAEQAPPLTPADHERFALPDFDLPRLAANLRGVMPRLDEEARDRLEHAWVAILNAIKQPKVDAARLAARMSRLADELDVLRQRTLRDEADEDGKPD